MLEKEDMEIKLRQAEIDIKKLQRDHEKRIRIGERNENRIEESLKEEKLGADCADGKKRLEEELSKERLKNEKYFQEAMRENADMFAQYEEQKKEADKYRDKYIKLLEAQEAKDERWGEDFEERSDELGMRSFRSLFKYVILSR